MLKRLGRLIVFAIVVVSVILVVRAVLLKPQTSSAPPATPIALDNDGAIQRFVGAIRIPTESKAGQPPDQDAMLKLRDYLQQSFPPRPHHHAARSPPRWRSPLHLDRPQPQPQPCRPHGPHGRRPAATETLSQWKHGPYSGDIAEGAIWGRGTLDDKIHVLSLLEAAETLIGRGYTPARTILFAFGDDEENGGKYGAQNIVKLLQQRNVHPDFVIDEGGMIVTGMVPGLSQPLAIIGTSEKGYLDAALSTKGTGGHSSEPPPHTAIGQLSAALTKLEAASSPHPCRRSCRPSTSPSRHTCRSPSA